MEGRAVARYFSGLPGIMQLASSEENREPLPMRLRLDRGSAEQQGNDEQDQEEHEEYFRDTGGGPCNTTEAEQPCNYGDDQKDD